MRLNESSHNHTCSSTGSLIFSEQNLFELQNIRCFSCRFGDFGGAGHPKLGEPFLKYLEMMN